MNLNLTKQNGKQGSDIAFTEIKYYKMTNILGKWGENGEN